MRISVIAVGKIKEKYLKDGIEEYRKRLSRFCDLELIEVEDFRAPEGLSDAQEQQVKSRECDNILKRIREGSTVIALDIRGESLGSEEFSRRINSFFVSGTSHITFIIGGSLGLDDRILSMARVRLSMSKLTFPHQLARMILLEQLFRAFKIMNGETYHK
ncbi:23S rRNA (pseudouridine1915-N3)-methyltransferase [Anaerobacterium chartisolvens]|uniref:Ribosomal RNA large subunit methyltransferase H n=1 Tax=Anaerobacterium chartisolvens TaxID=1297424 RepID=A0A369AJ21_9FIRM|nr:23S rRNA (pseudouridine(1915)-N(3))-methyltransferase RlmH [Anaerobacterium chartisolvens]RCX09085.1 23S rRNA (pseudouridine1915-N3)-methyltransferase [Anaerobacterium chartisolvens]